jgi:hypothetical protein
MITDAKARELAIDVMSNALATVRERETRGLTAPLSDKMMAHEFAMMAFKEQLAEEDSKRVLALLPWAVQELDGLATRAKTEVDRLLGVVERRG